jgi:hypothetical protein
MNDKERKKCVIDTLRDTYIDKSIDMLLSEKFSDTLDIDRFLLADVLHLLNQYEREMIKDAIQ